MKVKIIPKSFTNPWYDDKEISKDEGVINSEIARWSKRFVSSYSSVKILFITENKSHYSIFYEELKEPVPVAVGPQRS